jgi:hypothetical protein
MKELYSRSCACIRGPLDNAIRARLKSAEFKYLDADKEEGDDGFFQQGENISAQDQGLSEEGNTLDLSVAAVNLDFDNAAHTVTLLGQAKRKNFRLSQSEPFVWPLKEPSPVANPEICRVDTDTGNGINASLSEPTAFKTREGALKAPFKNNAKKIRVIRRNQEQLPLRGNCPASGSYCTNTRHCLKTTERCL